MGQPSKFELVINLKTAKALGLTIPQLVLGEPTKSSSNRRLMDRRAFIMLVGGSMLAVPLAGGAQPAEKVYRIGVPSRGISG